MPLMSWPGAFGILPARMAACGAPGAGKLCFVGLLGSHTNNQQIQRREKQDLHHVAPKRQDRRKGKVLCER